MNDRSLLHAILVLAVLSFASNVLVLKELRAASEATASPANTLRGADLSYTDLSQQDISQELTEIEAKVIKLEIERDHARAISMSEVQDIRSQLDQLEDRVGLLHNEIIKTEAEEKINELKERLIDLS